MKKAFFLPLLLCSFAFASCNSSPANMEEVGKLKALLAKQDLSPIYTKMFVSTFTQNYEYFSSTHGEGIEAETQFYSYRGGGMFGCLYEISEEAYQEVEALENPDFFDYLSYGRGSYGMLQTAAVASYHYDRDDARRSESVQTVDYFQRLDSVFGDDTLQIYNSLNYTEELGGAYDHQQSFNGIVDKKALFDTISPRALSNIFARTSLYDGQRSCETLDRIYYALLVDLSKKSDAALDTFITENAIRLEENEKNTLVHFRIADGEVRTLLSENEIIPGVFEGTLTYQKETGSFDAFNYKVVYLDNDSDDSNGNVFTASMQFRGEGYSWNKRFEEDLHIEPNPTVYDDPEAFLDDVVKEVIPPVF